METSEAITIVIFGVGLLLLFMLLVAVWRVGGGVLRVERRLAEMAEREKGDLPDPVEVQASRRSGPDRSRDGAYLEFLSEDSGRRELPKREQFAAYRTWRKERGLNWTKE